MKIAVTGASGFIGSYVLEALEVDSVDIVAVTRNPAKLAKNESIRSIINLDINNPGENIFELLGCPDVLIHLAWSGLPNYRSLHHVDAELPAQFNFLKNLIEGGLKSLIVTGTCFEYGMQSGPLASSLITKPDNPYGIAKDTLRKDLEFLKASHPFEFTWARLFYMFGDRQSPSSLYSSLKEAVLRGERVFNLSGGEQIRDYLPVKDLASQLATMAMDGRGRGIVNICSGNPISVRNLVERWLLENQWTIDLNFGYYPYPEYEPMEFWGVKDII